MYNFKTFLIFLEGSPQQNVWIWHDFSAKCDQKCHITCHLYHFGAKKKGDA